MTTTAADIIPTVTAAATGLRADAEQLAANVTTYTAEIKTLRAEIRRHHRNMLRATTARAQNRNADKLADAEHRMAEAARLLAHAEQWAPVYAEWATEAEARTADESAAVDALLAAVLDAPAADAPATTAEMIAAVRAHALKPEHYNAGWDTVTECYDDDDIREVLESFGATTVAAALEAFGTLADVWDDQRKTADHMFRY